MNNKSPFSHYKPHNPNIPLFTQAIKNNPISHNKENSKQDNQINLYCDQVFAPINFEQDLTCDEELQFKKSNEQKSPINQDKVSYRLGNNQKHNISPKPATATGRHKKVTQPASIDINIHCAKDPKFKPFTTPKNEKISQIQERGDYEIVFEKMKYLLENYQMQLRKKQQRIDYLEAQERKYRNI